MSASEAGRSWVAVLSSPLDEVDDNVALIRRQILIAGGIALVLALVAGYCTPRARSRSGSAGCEEPPSRSPTATSSTPIPIDSVRRARPARPHLQRDAAPPRRLDSARKEFIANASHELRTPIFSLGGFVELLEEEDPTRRSARSSCARCASRSSG